MNAGTWKEWGGKVKTVAERYKFVLLVLLAGVVLLLWPTGEPSDQSGTGTTQTQEVDYDVEVLEEKLSRTLSKVEGAGTVEVVLSVQSGPRQILARDSDRETGEGESHSQETTVILSRGSGVEDTVTVQQLSPQFRGALVVCSGGGDPSVRLALTEAVSALTGLGADKISICEGK